MTAADGSKKSAKCVVTVKAPKPEISGVAKLTVGNTATCKTTVSGGKWISSDESVLAFVSTGEKSVTVKAKKAGTASITYVANGIESNKISVNVTAAPKNDKPSTQILSGSGSSCTMTDDQLETFFVKLYQKISDAAFENYGHLGVSEKDKWSIRFYDTYF